jgi:hypothetical protein
VIGARTNFLAKHATSGPRYATTWTTRQKTMTEAAATAAYVEGTPQWRALQQLFAVDPGTANLVQQPSFVIP